MKKNLIFSVLAAVLLIAVVNGHKYERDDDNEYPEIRDYKQDSSTETSITVSWTIDTKDFTPLKYRMTVNDLLSTEFLCSTESCTYTVTGLSPCAVYKLTLVAVFALKEDTNTAKSIDGTTKYTVPGSISNLEDTGNKITWNAPANQQCVSYYHICYTSDFDMSETCVNVDDTQWTYNTDTVTGCDKLSISVSAGTADEQYGPPSVIQVETEYGIPSAPTNFIVSFVSEDEVLLQWDLPEKNAACIHDFSIQYGPADPVRIPVTKSVRQEYQATLTGLNMCTNYQIEVAAVSTTDELGAPAVDYAQTEDAPPEEIPDITIVPGTNDVIISWGDGTSDPCLGFIRICYSDPVLGQLVCNMIDVENPDGSYTIDGLVPCRSYSFIVEGISPDGTNGSIYTNSSQTNDVKPGPVLNLEVSTVSETSLGVKWDAPTEYEECVQEYIITYTNLEDMTQKTKIAAPRERADYEDILSGLDPCVDYRVSVSAVSASGKESEKVDTVGKTADTAPSAPRNLQVVTKSTDSITLLWYAPEERFCVYKYQVHFKEDGGDGDFTNEYIPVDPSAEQIVHTFTSPAMKSCTTYDITIKAYNANDQSTGDDKLTDNTAC